MNVYYRWFNIQRRNNLTFFKLILTEDNVQSNTVNKDTKGAIEIKCPY